MMKSTRTATVSLLAAWMVCLLLLTGCTPPSLVVEREDQLQMTQISTEAITELDLSNYRWQNRLLLIFAESAGEPAVMAQRQHFADERVGFADRELLTFYLYDAGMGEADSYTVDPTVTAALREEYDLAPGDFAVLLVGKDGGAKNRFDRPVRPEEIYSLIDAMPMRQREMREDE